MTMPMMLMAAVLPVALAGVVIIFFLMRRRLLNQVLVTVAHRQNGRVVPGPMGLYPMAVIPVDGVDLMLSGIHGSKSDRATCTFAWIGCEAYGDRTLDIQRKPKRVGMLERVGRKEIRTGHAKFDDAFWLADGELDDARDFLDEELREALLAFAPDLCVKIRVGELFAFPDGWRTGDTEPSLEIALHKLPPSVSDLERLVEVTCMAHERLRRESTILAA